MSSTRARPLDEVLTRALCDFTPEHPDRSPCHLATLDRVDLAVTDNRRQVNLRAADRVKLQRVGDPTYTRDNVEPLDWFPAGWGVGEVR